MKNVFFIALLSSIFLSCDKNDPPPPEITDPSLIAFYDFDGNAKDRTKYVNNGTANGAISYIADRKGRSESAIYFNGTNGYVQIPSSASLESPKDGITITAWVKAEEISTLGVFFLCKSNTGNLDPFQYRVGLTAANQMYFGFKNNNTSSYDIQGPLYALPNNQWKHVSYTFDGSSAKFFINGNKIGESVFRGVIFSDGKALEIGRDAHGPIEYFKGGLDEIRIYNRSLSEAEVNSLVADQN